MNIAQCLYRIAALFRSREAPPPRFVIDAMSIRARLAMGCVCLESFSRDQNCQSQKLARLLAGLWEFTSARWLDDWEDRISDLIPDNASEMPALLEGDSLTSPDVQLLFEMLEATFEIGEANLYGAFDTRISRKPTERLLQLYQQTGLPTPDWSVFLESSVLEHHGWGENRPQDFFRRAAVLPSAHKSST